MRERRTVSITCWNKLENGAVTESHFDVYVNKNRLRKFVDDWWTSYGSGINDFTTMKMEFKSERRSI